MKKQRFQVGDKVTYKDMYELPNEKYCYGGTNQKGYVGTITSYEHFVEYHNCYKIQVSTSIINGNFSMLESEFEEYDVVQEEHKFKVGDVVTTHKFSENTNIDFNDDSMLEYDGKKGKILKINEESCTVYVHGWWWPFSAIKLASEEPGSKFNIGDVVNTNDEGYQYTSMDKHAHDHIYDWSAITSCNLRTWFKSNIVVKDKVYSSIQDRWWYKFDEFCGNWTSECGISPITPVVNPMDAILEEAIRKYPIGTKYIPLTCRGEKYGFEHKVAYTPRIVHRGGYIDGGIGYLYAHGAWAEIVSETGSVFKDVSTIQSISPVTSSSILYNPYTSLDSVTIAPTTNNYNWGPIDSGFSISPCSEILLPEPIQNTMPDKDIVHRENTIKAMQL